LCYDVVCQTVHVGLVAAPGWLESRGVCLFPDEEIIAQGERSCKGFDLEVGSATSSQSIQRGAVHLGDILGSDSHGLLGDRHVLMPKQILEGMGVPAQGMQKATALRIA
jgi:hypothetical protein